MAHLFQRLLTSSPTEEVDWSAGEDEEGSER
jgi:hypothetical protein